jgi:hypothetical protein
MTNDGEHALPLELRLLDPRQTLLITSGATSRHTRDARVQAYGEAAAAAETKGAILRDAIRAASAC